MAFVGLINLSKMTLLHALKGFDESDCMYEQSFMTNSSDGDEHSAQDKLFDFELLEATRQHTVAGMSAIKFYSHTMTLMHYIHLREFALCYERHPESMRG